MRGDMAHIRDRDLKRRPDGKVVIEIKKSTYKNKQRQLKAARLEKAWKKKCASPKKGTP